MGLPSGSDSKESDCSAGDLGSIPGLERSPGEGNGWLPTPIFLPGEFHEQRSLAGYSPWGCKESETTEGVALFLSERTVFAPSGREQRKGEKQAGSCWGVLQQNFGDLFGFVAPDMLLQVGLSMGLSDTQVSNLAISSRLRFNTRESILGVKNLG